MKNELLRKLAHKAGFVFWGDEDYGPGPNMIDWSCDYTEDLEKFSKLLVTLVVDHPEKTLQSLGLDEKSLKSYRRDLKNANL